MSITDNDPQNRRSESMFDVLERLGYTTGPAANNLVGYRKAILKDGKVVFEGAAWDVWEWLRERGEA